MHPWDSSYPDPPQLRLEIGAMQQSILETLQQQVAPDNLLGVYTKGSSQKTWDSPMDYVPELSDLDVQVLLQDDTPLEDVRVALGFQAAMERRFRARVTRPLHLPCPQIQLLRSRLEHYAPSYGVQTLHGLPYEELAFGKPNHPSTDRAMLMEPQAFLTGLLDSVMDRHGKYMFDVLRQLSWRIGPTGSRILSVLGADFQTAWGGNRTQIYTRLKCFDQAELADHYAAFYLLAWDFFRSGYQNTNAAREAVLAGVAVLKAGLAIGSTVSVRPTSTLD
jgi:hypothetical protein